MTTKPPTFRKARKQTQICDINPGLRVRVLAAMSETLVPVHVEAGAGRIALALTRSDAAKLAGVLMASAKVKP